MRKIIMYQALIALLSLSAFGQTSVSEFNRNEKSIEKICNAGVSNKAISLCNIQADTLTYDQIRSCNELVISGEPSQQILNYSLIIVYPDGSTIHEYYGKGSNIPAAVVEEIITSNTKKVFFEKVYVASGTDKKCIGYRGYNFR